MTWHSITGHAIGAHPRNGFGEGGGYRYRGGDRLVELNAAIMAARGGQPATWGRGEAPPPDTRRTGAGTNAPASRASKPRRQYRRRRREDRTAA